MKPKYVSTISSSPLPERHYFADSHAQYPSGSAGTVSRLRHPVCCVPKTIMRVVRLVRLVLLGTIGKGSEDVTKSPEGVAKSRAGLVSSREGPKGSNVDPRLG